MSPLRPPARKHVTTTRVAHAMAKPVDSFSTPDLRLVGAFGHDCFGSIRAPNTCCKRSSGPVVGTIRRIKAVVFLARPRVAEIAGE